MIHTTVILKASSQTMAEAMVAATLEDIASLHGEARPLGGNQWRVDVVSEPWDHRQLRAKLTEWFAYGDGDPNTPYPYGTLLLWNDRQDRAHLLQGAFHG